MGKAGKKAGAAASSGAAAGAGEYQEPLAVYAERYGKALRSVKRWVAIGRAAGDPPPLDAPAEMAGWWSRHMTWAVPDRLLEMAGGVVPAAEVVPPEAPAAGGEEVAAEVALEIGLEAELGRLQRLAADLSVAARQPGQAKAYLDAVNRMTILQGRLREEAEKERRLLPRDAVEAAIHEFHGPIEREIRMLYRTMCEKLGLGPTPEIEDGWNRECDRIFARFGEEVLR
jgi:hypothetical protein